MQLALRHEVFDCMADCLWRNTAFSVDMGYAYGFMLSKEISYAYHSLLDAVIGHNALDQVRQS